MAFDLQRALQEGLLSRIPFLDRLLSYCYFAEMSVLEVASYDSRGRGVSLVGRVGPDDPEAVVLVCPLPSQAAQRGPLETPRDQRRALRILASTWAMATVADLGPGAPSIGLIAAHPDSDGEALSQLARERDLLRPRRFLVLGDRPPSGVHPVGMDGMLVHLEAPLPVQSLPRPLRDIQVWRWQSGPGLFHSLGEVFAIHREGRIVPLFLGPRQGCLLEEPLDAEVTVGILDPDVLPPPGWERGDSPSRVRSQGSWGRRFLAFQAGFTLLDQALRTAWNGRVPDGAIRVVALGQRDPSGIDLLIWLPRGGWTSTRDFLAHASLPEGASLVIGHVRQGDPESSREQEPVLPPGMALCLPEGIPVLALGSRRFEGNLDPIQEALGLAEELRGFLRDLGRFRRRES